MNLNQWIDSVGGRDAAAEILGEKVRTVASWYRLERAPSFNAALNVHVKSGRLVDFNGIYCPLAQKFLEQGK